MRMALSKPLKSHFSMYSVPPDAKWTPRTALWLLKDSPLNTTTSVAAALTVTEVTLANEPSGATTVSALFTVKAPNAAESSATTSPPGSVTAIAAAKVRQGAASEQEFVSTPVDFTKL